MLTDFHLTVIIQIISLLIIGYGIYFKSYFKKKGENLATKEDISEITKKIEGVKYEFNVDLEKSRSILQKELHKNSLFLNERTSRLLDLYDSVIVFRLEYIGFQPWNEMSKDWYQTFKDHHDNTFKAFRMVNRNYLICSVFLHDHPELLDSVHNLMKDVGRVFNVFKSSFSDVKISFIKEQEAFESTDRGLIDTAVEKSNIASEKYGSKLDIEQFSLRLDDFIEELSKFFRVEAEKIK